MKIKNLPPTTLATIKKMRYDRIIEKHEGPETWDWLLDVEGEKKKELKEFYKKAGADYEPSPNAEFMNVGRADVLLPVPSDHYPNMTILHHFFSEDRLKMVLYIKDTTYFGEDIYSGFVAICDKFPNEEFYITTLYHEWFTIDYDPLADRWKEK